MRLIPRRPPWACSSMGLDRGVAVLISDSLTWVLSGEGSQKTKAQFLAMRRQIRS
jgi:hypothetical protein